jgi:excinuclease UvrABC nuclease subunit
VEAERDIRRYRVDRFILYPVHWENYPSIYCLNRQKVKFDSSHVRSVPNDKRGVYTFVAEAATANHPACSYLLYVGKAEKQGLRKRYVKYLRAPREWRRRVHITRMVENWADHLWFYYAEIDDWSLIDQVEKELITAFLPPMNREWREEITELLRMIFS